MSFPPEIARAGAAGPARPDSRGRQRPQTGRHSMNRGLGYRFDLEDRPWLRADFSLRFAAARSNAVGAGRGRPALLHEPSRPAAARLERRLRTACEERLNQLATKTTAKLLLSMMFAYLTNQKGCGCRADNGATIAGSVQAAGKEGVCHETLCRTRANTHGHPRRRYDRGAHTSSRRIRSSATTRRPFNTSARPA